MIELLIHMINAISVIGILAGICDMANREKRIKRQRLILLFFLLMIGIDNGTANEINQARLSWNKNNEPDMLYYTVYRGTKTREYSRMATVDHPDTSIVIDNIATNTTYFFVVTATDTAGNESGYSNEIEFTVFDTTGQSQEIADGFNYLNPAIWKRGMNAANITTVENGILALRSNAREAGWVHTVNRFPLRNRTIDVYFAKTGGSCNIGFSPTIRSESIDGIVSEANMLRVYIAHVSATTRGIYLQEKKDSVVTMNTLLVSDERFQTSPVALRLKFSETAMQILYSFADEFIPIYLHPVSDMYRLGSFVELLSYYTISWEEAHVDSFALHETIIAENRFDFTKDGIIDIFDWIFLLRHIGIKSDGGEYLPELDLNADGWIDGIDKASFARSSGFV